MVDERADAGRRACMNVTEVLAQAVERHHPRLVMLCSFQKEESVLSTSSCGSRPTRGSSRSTPACCSRRRSRPGGPSRSASGSTSRSRTRPATGPALSTAAASARSPRSSARWAASTPGSRASAASSRPRGRTRSRSSGMTSAASGSSTRSSSGRRRICGVGSRSATCRTTRCMTRGTRRSAALRARTRAPAATGDGPA